jgi:hypothetical protein
MDEGEVTRWLPRLRYYSGKRARGPQLLLA